MALPVILVNSATGSDTAASGAGPATALTGTAASTDAGGTVVTLDGSPDLTNVATDGSHVIFLNDTTAGNRNFGKITAKDDGADTVTVSNAFGGTLSGKSWAIGGKRASIGATTSVKLFENNAAAGDAMPGWTIEMESGHSETIAATITWRRDGDTTDGPITLRGTAGAGTLPLLTFTNNGNAFSHASRVYTRLEGFEMRNSNATKTASVALAGTLRKNFVLRNIKVSHSADKFWRVLSGINCYGIFITNCEFGYCADSAIHNTSGAHYRFIVLRSYIHDCGAAGVVMTAGSGSVLIQHSIMADNAGDGITILPLSQSVSGSDQVPCSLLSNVFHNNTGDGVEITLTSSGTGTLESLLILNNIFSANGAYGLKFSGSGVTDALLANLGTAIRNNDFYNNTSGAHSPTLTLASLDQQTLDPQFTDAANGNFLIGTNLRALGFPTGVIGRSATTSYMDIGAAQRAERPRARSLVGV